MSQWCGLLKDDAVLDRDAAHRDGTTSGSTSGPSTAIQNEAACRAKQLLVLAESEDRKNIPDGMDVPQGIARWYFRELRLGNGGPKFNLAFAK